MRHAARALVAALLVAVAMLSAAGMASGDPFTTPSTDPVSDDYNPRSWLIAWNADEASTSEKVQAVATGDAHAGLDQTGMTIASQPAQWAALTQADRTELNAAWGDGLLAKTWTRTQKMFHVVNNNSGTAMPWSAADSDSAARDLGGSSYSALSPGLKSIVQRIATIVTGEYKPAMPDDAWASWMNPEVRAAFDARPVKFFDYKSVVISATPTAGTVITVCAAGALNWACEATKAVADGVGTAADIASDPLAWLTSKMAAGASGLMAWIAGAASESTAPDLTAAWWINAYTTGMAIGVLLLGFVLLWQIIQKARGAIDSRDLVESFVVWGPAYFAGIVFGPPLAQFLIVGSGALTDGIVSSLTGYSAGDASTEVMGALDGAAQGTVVGSAIIALIILLVIIVSAFMVFVSLAVQSVAVYLACAVFAVAFAWIVSTRQRGGSLKIPLLFLGMIFSRPLLFFLLGIGLAITRQATTLTDEPGRNLATLVMAAVVLVIAGFAPMLLLKYAPISPTGMGGGAALGGGAAAAGIGAAVAGGSKLAGLANTRAAHRAAKTAGGTAARSAGSGGVQTTMSTGVGSAAAAGGAGSGPGSGMSRAARQGSVSQRLNRAPRSTGGAPSVRGASLAARIPTSAGSTSGGRAASGGSTGTGSARTPVAAAAGSTRPVGSSSGPLTSGSARAGSGGVRAAATSGTAASVGRGGSSGVPPRPTPNVAVHARRAAGGAAAAAREATSNLDGDQQWTPDTNPGRSSDRSGGRL